MSHLICTLPYLCTHLSESIHSWTKGTQTHPTPTLPSYPNPYPPTLPYPTLPYPTPPYPSLPHPYPTLEHFQKAVFLWWSFLEVYIFAPTYRKAFIVGPKVPKPTPPYPTLLPQPIPSYLTLPYPTPPYPSLPHPYPTLEHFQKAVFLWWSFLEVYIFATTYRKAFIVGPKVPKPTPPYPTLLPQPIPSYLTLPYPTPPYPSLPHPYHTLEHFQKAVFLCWNFLEVYIFAPTYRKAFIVGPKVPKPTPPYPTLLPQPIPSYLTLPYPILPHPTLPYPIPTLL